ncbi:MAG: hypothetical protein NTW92_08000 [Bacteroidetes bacterium]|nr:hypothetical protein [Bacteroidota bacterium]
MRKITILVILVLMLGNFNNKAAAQGLLTRLIEIKYTAELYLSSAIKQVGSKNDGKDGEGGVVANAKDSALAIYNTLRWKVDGLVYQLSGDMVAANSPRKIRLLNKWCLQQPEVLMVAHINESNKNKSIQTYTLALKEIDAIYRTQIANPMYAQTKNINLTTNVFYLLKDSYTIIKGLSDMKTQKTMALIELLDHTRLVSPGEIAKQGK